MEVIHARCAGLDISKRDAKVCVRVAGAGRRKTVETVTTWGSMTPPMLFKPVTVMARLGLLTKLGPYVAARRGRVRQVLSIGYQHPGRLPNEIVDAYSDPVLGTPDSARALARIITALSSDDLAAVRPGCPLTAPTFIVWGTGDHLFFKTKWAHQLADLIPATVAFHTIDGARMHFPDEHAEQFIPLLRQHWATHPE